MAKSEELLKQASEEDNDLKSMGLYIKGKREKRGEDFKEEILPKLLKKGYYTECNETYTKYTINITIEQFGIIDFFPKKNKVLIRKDNKWLENGRNWLIKNLKL